jgi:hypothetical protein
MARYRPKDYEVVLAELDGASDRAVILVSGSLIDHALAEAATSRLREPSTDAAGDELLMTQARSGPSVRRS